MTTRFSMFSSNAISLPPPPLRFNTQVNNNETSRNRNRDVVILIDTNEGWQEASAKNDEEPPPSYSSIFVKAEKFSPVSVVEAEFGNFDGLNGFMTKICTSYLKLVSTPMIHVDPLLAGVVGNEKFIVEAKRRGNCYCCVPSSRTCMIFSYKRNNEIKLRVNWPIVNNCIGKIGRERIVDIICPSVGNKIIGRIEVSDIAKGAILKNLLTAKTFIITKVDDQASPTVQFVEQTSDGHFPVAAGRAVGGTKTIFYNGGCRSEKMSWDEFQLMYASRDMTLTDKALILASFNTWICEREERKRQASCFQLILYVLAFLCIVGLIIWVKWESNQSSFEESDQTWQTASPSPDMNKVFEESSNPISLPNTLAEEETNQFTHLENVPRFPFDIVRFFRFKFFENNSNSTLGFNATAPGDGNSHH